MSTYSAIPVDNLDEQCSGPPSYEVSQAEYESSRLLESTHAGGSEETTNDENRINEDERTGDGP